MLLIKCKFSFFLSFSFLPSLPYYYCSLVPPSTSPSIFTLVPCPIGSTHPFKTEVPAVDVGQRHHPSPFPPKRRERPVALDFGPLSFGLRRINPGRIIVFDAETFLFLPEPYEILSIP